MGPVAPVSPAGPVAPVAPVAPCGMTKSKVAACGVPLFVTAASVPGSPVVIVPTSTVAAVPAAPVGPVGPVTPVAPVAPSAPVGQVFYGKRFFDHVDCLGAENL